MLETQTRAPAEMPIVYEIVCLISVCLNSMHLNSVCLLFVYFAEILLKPLVLPPSRCRIGFQPLHLFCKQGFYLLEGQLIIRKS